MSRTNNGLSVALLSVAVLLLLYVLSIGPAISLASYGQISRSTFQKAYSPLRRTARLTSFTQQGLSWYLDLWPRSPTDEGCVL